MATPTKIVSFVKRGLELVVTQLRGKTKFEALLSSYLAEIDEIETALWEIQENRWLDTAEGEQLDGLGRILGARRNGDDEQYRLRLRARILILLSSGTIPQILRVFRLLVDADATITYTARYPAAYQVRISNQALEDYALTELSLALTETCPAGVNGQLLYQVSEDADTFTFSSSSAFEASAAQGMGDTSNAATGGEFSGAVLA